MAHHGLGAGGTVYRSDTWGLQNLTTGGYVAEGEPFNYTRFTGQGFKDDQVPIDNRAVHEQVYGHGRRTPQPLRRQKRRPGGGPGRAKGGKTLASPPLPSAGRRDRTARLVRGGVTLPRHELPEGPVGMAAVRQRIGLAQVDLPPSVQD